MAMIYLYLVSFCLLILKTTTVEYAILVKNGDNPNRDT